MPTNKIATILKVAVWPAVVLILAVLFMFLFRSSLEQFINKWENLKLGGVEVQVKNEQEKAFLENVLAERDALIASMRENVDSMKFIIKDLEIENEILVNKLKETSSKLPYSDRSDVEEIVDHSKEKVQASRMQTKSIEQSVNKQYKSLQLISSNKVFQEAAAAENKGFELLLEDKLDEAIQAFETSEEKYPSIKQEGKALSVYIQDKKRILQSNNKRLKQEVFSDLLTHYSDKMSEKTKKQIKEKVQKVVP